VPLGHGMPTVEPEDVAAAIVRSVHTRRAEIPVPGYLAGWSAIEALVPERAMVFVRALLRDRRALTSVDAERRREYADRVARQQREAGRRAWAGDA